MKTHELISLAEYISKIMTYYPNKSVEYALGDILILLNGRSDKLHANKKTSRLNLTKNSKGFKSSSSPQNHPLDESATLSSKPDHSLNDLSIVELKKIANEIGIKTSSRQNKAILVMNISKTVERRKIDSTIQDKDKDKDKDENKDFKD